MKSNNEMFAEYCPICGVVYYPKKDENGNDPKPRSCCDNAMIIIAEPCENFHKEKANTHKEKHINDIYIQKKYVINNPLYDQEAHIERLLNYIERNTNQGYKSPYELKELEEICGVHMEQPEVTATPKSFYIPSSTVKCPRCGSTSITTQKKGFGVGKAAAGVLAVGLAGALAGGIGANKAVNVCQKCGHKWEPGR